MSFLFHVAYSVKEHKSRKVAENQKAKLLAYFFIVVICKLSSILLGDKCDYSAFKLNILFYAALTKQIWEEILLCVLIIVSFIQDLQRCLKIVIEIAYPKVISKCFINLLIWSDQYNILNITPFLNTIFFHFNGNLSSFMASNTHLTNRTQH